MPEDSSECSDIVQKHSKLSSEALQRILEQAECDSSAPLLAILGPGSEAGPGWVVILKIDQQKSTGAANEHRWLVI